KYNLGNPLPASISVITSHPKYHAGIEKALKKPEFSAYLSNISAAEDQKTNAILQSVSTNLIKVSDFTNQVLYWLIITFIIGGSLIILNALHITIFTRKKEIEVMKMVGSSLNFIRLPYLIESIIYAVLAVILSFIMMLIVSKNLNVEMHNLQQIFIIELFVAILINLGSSFIAIHEHINEIK
ncbi:hypothetical protein KJ632_02355, partial [Patescibacteria group bacterium]|nr:hypothetical protein [Patescibacteria group bacterium]